MLCIYVYIWGVCRAVPCVILIIISVSLIYYYYNKSRISLVSCRVVVVSGVRGVPPSSSPSGRVGVAQLFYYIGPASVAFALRRRGRRPKSGKNRNGSVDGEDRGVDDEHDESGTILLLRDDDDGDGDDGDASSSSCYGATSSSTAMMPLLPRRRKSDDGPSNDAASAAAVRDDATHHRDDEENDDKYDEYDEYDEYDYCHDVERYYYWPSRPLLYKASCIAFFDIFAQSMVYAGNNLAGPTIFSIVYSSVTIWAALYSKLLLDRSLSKMQWMGVLCVVFGLSLTALDSKSMGKNVFWGAVLIVVGTSGHGLTYVFSEKIMTATTKEEEEDKKNHKSTMATSSSTASTSSSTRTASSTRSGTDDADHHRNHGNAQPIREESSSRLRLRQRRHHHRRRRRDDDDDRDDDDTISVRANCAIQGLVASSILLVWQLVYTLPNVHALILLPMSKAGTSPPRALCVLSAISLSNLLHSATFFVTLKHVAGGATSAGVLKGLQAVLVFGASSALLCGRWEGTGGEMCWSASKLVSLSVVLCGIGLYAAGGAPRLHGGGGGATDATTTRKKKKKETTADDDDDDDDDDGDGGIMCV